MSSSFAHLCHLETPRTAMSSSFARLCHAFWGIYRKTLGQRFAKAQVGSCRLPAKYRTGCQGRAKLGDLAVLTHFLWQGRTKLDDFAVMGRWQGLLISPPSMAARRCPCADGSSGFYFCRSCCRRSCRRRSCYSCRPCRRSYRLPCARLEFVRTAVLYCPQGARTVKWAVGMKFSLSWFPTRTASS